MAKINIYIDGNNLYRGAKTLGFKIDYKKLRGWLRQKYNPQSVYLCIGFVSTRIEFYSYLKKNGFILVFKQTVSIGDTIKGNCDAELVLKVMVDFYTQRCDSFILITGDGDFGCLVEFLRDNNVFYTLISPDSYRCSALLKNKNVEIIFLNEHYHKFSNKS